MTLLETVEIDAAGTPDGSVIWLHGLGADGHDFEPIVAELQLQGRLNLRFIFPHAPVRAVTINAGVSMRAWYDILTMDRDGPIDEDGIRESSRQLIELIEREHERGVAYDKILLAGFSQGGAIASHTAMRLPQRVAGLMALSTYLPLQRYFADEVASKIGDDFRNLPIFMAHGSGDTVLPMALGERSRDLLQANGFNIDWHEYPMAHAVCAQEIDDIRSWLLATYAVSD